MTQMMFPVSAASPAGADENGERRADLVKSPTEVAGRF